MFKVEDKIKKKLEVKFENCKIISIQQQQNRSKKMQVFTSEGLSDDALAENKI